VRKKKAFIQKEGKEKDEKRERENPDDERRHKIISSLVLFLFLFRSFNEEEHHLEKTEKRSIKRYYDE
jgi:hypothetical protein